MAIEVIHASDIHLGSGESHGVINPQTGLNTRFEDFQRAFSKAVDFALELPCDLFLFSGDAYKTAAPEPQYQQAFARQLKRLADAKVPCVLLVGNHDQIWKSTGSHSMSVFQTLEIPGVTVIDKPEVIRLETAKGPLQIFGLPYVTKHLMLTHQQYAGLSDSAGDEALVSLVSDLVRASYEELDPSLPTVVTAHCMTERARAGVEQELMVGYTLSFPVEFFVDERIDYVALGHVHKYQVLRESRPCIAYCGSIERVDFSEETEDKGFIHASIERRNVSIKFHSIGPRPFVTVEADLTSAEEPTAELVRLVKKKVIPGCVLRVLFKIQQHRLTQVDENAVRDAAAQAMSIRMRPLLSSEERPPRLPEINDRAAGEPLPMLEKYLDQISVENKESLLRKVHKLAARLADDTL